MAVTIKQTESEPEEYNLLPAVALATVAWQRIEPYIAHRFSPRTVAWIVEGPGEWHPPLTPATISTVEVWSSADEWETATLAASPLGGYFLPCTGPYRFAGSVGSPHNENPPDNIVEAVKRLAAYLAAKPGKPGAMSESITAGSISISHRRSESWMASALQNSGAADLLRAFRKV
ncbi:MAG TPA: hypothetical protein VNR11_09255 [Xanthobacteraceae bacterium]|nr:hypothetical protein [Xanthobacteraceae bacterium]